MAYQSYGHSRTRPRTEIFLNSSGLGSAFAASEKKLVLLGSAHGGKPHEPYEVTSYSQAKEIFRGGELLDAIEMAWNPSPNQNGAGRIIAVRVEEATQATLIDGSVTVSSTVYGQDANGIQISLEDNAITDSKRFSVYFTKERYEKIYDNIGNIFNIQYTGSELTAMIDVEVDPTSKLATKLNLNAGDSLVRSYELGAGVYENINVVVNDINNLPDFEAQMNVVGDKNVPSDSLDVLVETDIKTESVTVKAIAGDLERQTRNDSFVEVTVDRTIGVPANIELKNLAGGTSGEVPASWGSILDKVANLGAYYIVPLTDEPAIHAEVSQLTREESNNGNTLRAFVGAGLNEGLNELKARQMQLLNPRVGLVGNSGKRKMSDGRVYNFPAYMFAALIAGVSSGLAIGEPITYKHVNIEALDRIFKGDELDQLDDSGVIMVEFVRNRATTHFRIVSEATTYNSDREPVRNRIGLGEISDFLTTDLRDILDSEFIGTRVQNTSASILKNRVESFLDSQMKVGGLIVDYSPDDVQVIITGRSARISFTVIPAQGLDYINVYIDYQDQDLAG